MHRVILLVLLALTSCATAKPKPNPYRHMNLSEIATHICEQVGMNDTDDVSAAKMFLQRRLEMIWNTQLWRCSLIEATMTLATDGTVNLDNTIWIPSRATLLLPPEIDSVLAVRQNGHTMNVAGLESYYRQDTDWLNMQGDPTEFQILSPEVLEFETATDLVVTIQSSQDVGKKVYLAYSTDGVTKTNLTITLSATETVITGVLKVIGYSKDATTGNVIFSKREFSSTPIAKTYSNWSPAGDPNISPLDILTRFRDYTTEAYTSSVVLTEGQIIRVIGGVDGIDNSQVTLYITVDNGNGTYYSARYKQNGNLISGDYADGSDSYDQFGLIPNKSLVYTRNDISILSASNTAATKHQRIRLTTAPQVETTLRVLGKMACPILSDYDEVPINNGEPCLMAFARGDMLMRQRQHGKAQLAQQEGAALLKQLADSEAFQQAGNRRIMPDGGFGGDYFNSQYDSSHPL